MKTSVASVAVVTVCMLAAGIACAESKKAVSGEELFKQHCMSCHPDGGNIVNPQKTLGKEALKSRKITSPKDIVKIMRKPGPGMTMFDAKTIPDKDAKAIAEYILKTFK